jgi:predicted extracellular nuclease/endonuclease I
LLFLQFYNLLFLLRKNLGTTIASVLTNESSLSIEQHVFHFLSYGCHRSLRRSLGSKKLIIKSRNTDPYKFSGENMKLKYPVALALFCVSSAQATSVFINEIHYDNIDGDLAELVEVAAPAGTNLSGMTVVLYNGSSSQLKPYSTLNLSGVVGDRSNGYGFVTVNGPSSGIQNGAPDGLALVDSGGQVIQFLSYEGSFTAAEGPAAGMSSVDIGQSESGSTPVGHSLQLSGSGSVYSDFTWVTPALATAGDVNNGQSFGGDEGQDDSPDSDVISGSVCTNCPDVPKIKDISLFDATNYYAAAQTEVDLNSSPEIIKAAITDIISTDHKNLSYSEVWTSLTYTDEDPLNTNNVILWYSNRSQAKSTNGSGAASSNGDNWNREHSWPKSHGFSSSSLEAYTDIHHLRPTDISINSSRGNLDFDNSDSPLAESTINRVDGDSFEPRDDVKGDVARMMFYMDTRYEGSGSDSTPDLQLVNRITTTSESKLGWLCTLAAWNAADPVDVSEELRNDRIYELQGNRNPFTDNPTWVEILYPATECDSGGGEPVPEPEPEPEPEPTPDDDNSSVFINEIHYDNTGGDTGEGIEIAGLAGTDLDGLSLVLYNGSNGTTYNTVALSGVLPNQQNGFGTLPFAISGIQNGSPDGMALVDALGNVIQFLSYEGSLTATNGPADGMTGVDIGVAEAGSAAVGTSLQLTGTGYQYSDFIWANTSADNFGAVNTGQTFVAPEPFINEIHYDNTGGDTGEGIEIAGLAGTDLDGLSLVLYNGSNGTTYNTVALSGVLPNQQNGFGTLPFAISGIQNGSPDGMALVDALGNVIQFLSYEGSLTATNGPADGMTGLDIGVAEAGSAAVGTSLQLTGSGFAYSDFTWAGSSAETLGSINAQQTFGLGGGGSDGGDGIVIGVCAEPASFIHEVQGAGDSSPLEGETLIVEAVVTAAFEAIDGFFIQEEDADADADATTSEGLFVAFSGDLPVVGSVVRVLGDVAESFGKTQINVTENWLECGNGTSTATPATLNLPFAGTDSAESLEGMLVTTNQELTVSDNFRLGRYGEVALSNGRLYIPTNVFLPGSSEAQALAIANSLNVVYMGDANPAQNPEPIIFPAGNLSAVNTLRSGDTVSSVTGVLDYDFGKYLINPTVAPTFAATNPRTAAPDLRLGNLKVASLNVLNFFNGDGQGGGFPTSRGADSIEEYERQIAKTVEAIVIMDADIVGLMEIENDGFDSFSAIAQLAAAVNAAMGENVYSYVNADGPVGTDAITVGLLYKNSVVSLSGAVDILNSDNSISDEQGPLFNTLKNRPAMSQMFTLTENGEQIVISVNHLKSKGSSCGEGDDDTTIGQGNCNGTRTRAATGLVAHLAQNFTDLPTLIIGDLNSYAKEQPITTIAAAGYTNLVEYFQGSKAYSYTFNGELGYLDHALGNNKVLAKIVDVTEWHINADEPIVLDYNVEFQTETQQASLYAPDQYRMSDHDPVLIALQIDTQDIGAETSADVNDDGSINFTDYFAILGMLGSVSGDANFNAIADYDSDDVISTADLQAWYQLYLSQ